ncbi:helix-turn-helix transcriptional regulator [Nocardia otitidiscaviarum]|uniref:ArsR/SmtB family transcription factor n=1 Tax=Nocardia otitidiscaviarum TaxID=1823 RepID=UPI0004A71E8F|nr:helix-turn-helix transcriptional regulator [Nocardia otitidiscaviarum]MBF6133054.1 helix-turn-helix transcriptional regulator [Nocardia otitidiscaviarum]MBF6486449.1 helix-turn-helix transcriptional regulator [Nocardia otitidiscaviarum]
MGEPQSTKGSPVQRGQLALRGVDIRAWARRFDLLSDPGRLEILLCLHRCPGITVGELAAATGRTENSISQALRVLRHENFITSTRMGRAVANQLDDPIIHEVLHNIGATHD